MMKRSLVIASIVLASAIPAFAQNSNQNTNSSTRTRTVAPPKPSPTPKTVTKPSDTETPAATSPRTRRPKTTATAPSTGVLAAFNKIVDGIRRSNVDMYTGGYWNSRDLVLFNYNGTVTKGWEQLRKNRESSFPDAKEVKLEVRDYHMQMLGRDGAVVTCLWTQSQTYRGQPDNASGRMTLVFKRFGTEWKAVHLHTSPDKPEPSRIPPSEQATPKPTP